MKAFILLCCFCLLSVVVLAQNAKIDSLKKVIATTKVDTVKGRSLARLSTEFRKLSEFETAFKLAEDGLAFSKSNRDHWGMASCFLSIGNIYYAQGSYPQATAYYEKSLLLWRTLQNKKGIANCLMNLGNMYYAQGYFPKALENFHQSYKIWQELRNKKGLANCLMNLGNVYYTQRNPTKALEFYQKSLILWEQIGDPFDLANCHLNLSNVYDFLGNYNEALKQSQRSLIIREAIGDKNGVAECLSNIGMLFKFKKNYPTALEYFEKSHDIYKSINNEAGICVANCALSSIYLKLNRPDLAKNYSRKGLKLAQQINHLEWMKFGAEVSYHADSALGDYQSAFEYHKLYKQYSDSLHNEDKAKEFGRVESKYQFEKEADTAKRREAEAKRNEQLETDRRNNLQYLSIFGGLLLLFGGLAFVGKLKIPARVLDITLFAALLILFEFLLILFDPILDQYTGGIPIQKLVFNSLIALGFAPLHGFLEEKLKRRFSKNSE